MAQVTYREANRRYNQAYWPLMGLYAVACIGGALLVKEKPPEWAVASIAVLTAAPIAAVFWVLGRLLNETDEYTRKLHTGALLTGGAITFSLVTAWGFLELYGVVPHLRYFPATLFVWPAFFVFYGIAFAIPNIRDDMACRSGAGRNTP